MKLLQFFNVIAFLATATFAVNLGVVLLLYAIHHDLSPQIASEWGGVALITGGFWLLAVTTGLTWWMQRRVWRGRWVAQGLSSILLAIGAVAMTRYLQG